MHNVCCFAGQPAPCPGYFANDVLPCICESKESLLPALSQVAIAHVPLKEVLPEVHILPMSA